MKKIYYLFILILFIIPFNVYAIIPKSEYEYVTDGAKILNEDTFVYMVKMSSFLRKSERIKYYVVTISDLEGLDAEEYCNRVFEQYKIGDNGLLILVDKNDAVIRVQIGTKLATIFTERMITKYIDTYFIPYIEHGDWDMGVLNGYNAFLKKICDYYNIDTSSIEVVNNVDFMTKYLEYILGALMLILLLICKLEIVLYKKIFRNKKSNNMILECLLFALLLIANIVVILLPLLVKKEVVIIFIVAEALAFYSFWNSNSTPVADDPHEIIERKKKQFNREKKDNHS